MHLFLIHQLATERQHRMIADSERRRLAKLAPRQVKAPRDFSATLVVAGPYELTALNLPTHARNEPYSMRLEPTLMPTPQTPHGA
jgi:hypothetical protein